MTPNPPHFDAARLARRTDPASSHVAAEHAAEFSEGHEAKILRALEMSPKPLTIGEIGAITGLTSVQVARRTGKLEESKRIRREAARRCMVAGAECQTWAWVDAAAEATAARGDLFGEPRHSLPD